jgi:hypothetical protein
MCPADTSPEAWDIYLSLQRKLTPSERMQQVLEWSDVIRELGMAGLVSNIRTRMSVKSFCGPRAIISVLSYSLKFTVM